MIKKLAFLLLLAPFALTLSATPTEEVTALSAQELYIQGIKLEAIDTKHATDLIKKSAELNYEPALIRMGLITMLQGRCYDNQCNKEAFFYFSRAAERNNPAAINNLALAYQFGRGVQKDSKKASELFDQANNLGSKKTPYFKRMIEWLKANPKQLHFVLENLYDDGANFPLEILSWKGMEWSQYHKKIKGAKELAYTFLTGAVATQEPAGRILLANAYIAGKIVPRNRSEGIKLLNEEIASANPHPEAILRLAFLYRKGTGVKKNLQKAFELYTRYAELTGDYLYVIWCHHHGIGTPADYKKCIEYCSQFKTQLNQEILHLYARLLYFGDGAEQNTQLAQELLESALRCCARYDNRPSKYIDFAATGSSRDGILKSIYSFEKSLRKNGPKHKDKQLKKEWAQLLREMPQKYDQLVQERNEAADKWAEEQLQNSQQLNNAS